MQKLFLLILIEALVSINYNESNAAAVGLIRGWSHNFDGLMINGHNASATIKASNQEIADKFRAFYTARPSEKKNLATVKIFYVPKTAGFSVAPTQYNVPRIFISGWGDSSKLNAPSEAALNVQFPIGSEHTYLEDCYHDGPGGGISLAERDDLFVARTTNINVQHLIDDFQLRGITLDSPIFPTTSYAHSEQTFISCALRDKIRVSAVAKPKAILVVINSHHLACASCEPSLAYLFEDPVFKNAFIRSLFPATHAEDMSGVPLSILYTASDLRPLPDIDFSVGEHYIDTRL